VRCLKCGGEYQRCHGTLGLRDKFVGEYEVHDVDYLKCEKCERYLFPEKTAREIERKREQIKKQLIGRLPVAEFIPASDAAKILGISRQALHKHRRIRRGFIYSIKIGGRTLYYLDSVLKFRESGDGRFPLFDQSSKEQSSDPAPVKSAQDMPKYKVQCQ